MISFVLITSWSRLNGKCSCLNGSDPSQSSTNEVIMQLTWLCFKDTQALGQIIRLLSPRNTLTLIIHHNDPDMEVTGLIIGIAGLFSACLEAADRVQSYRSFGADSHILGTRFQAAKIVLEQWGARAGFENDTLSQKHSPELDQPDIKIAVKDVLTIIVIFA